MNKYNEDLIPYFTSTSKYYLNNQILFEKINDKDLKISLDEKLSAIFPINKFKNVIKNRAGSVTYKGNNFKLKFPLQKTGDVFLTIKINGIEKKFKIDSLAERYDGLFYFLKPESKLYISILGYNKKSKNKNYDYLITSDEKKFTKFYTAVTNVSKKEIEDILNYINSDDLAKKNTAIGITGKIDIDLKKFENLNIKIFDNIANINSDLILDHLYEYDEIHINDLFSIGLGLDMIFNSTSDFNLENHIKKLKNIEEKILKKNCEPIGCQIPKSNFF